MLHLNRAQLSSGRVQEGCVIRPPVLCDRVALYPGAQQLSWSGIGRRANHNTLKIDSHLGSGSLETSSLQFERVLWFAPVQERDPSSRSSGCREMEFPNQMDSRGRSAFKKRWQFLLWIAKFGKLLEVGNQAIEGQFPPAPAPLCMASSHVRKTPDGCVRSAMQ